MGNPGLNNFFMKNIFLIAFGILIFQISTAQDASNTRYMNQPWKMHHIDRQFWNHNSLSPGDVDKDGLVDYLVIHEGADKVTILFNPGVGNQLYHEWEKVVISDGNNIEYGYFGDLNGDGNLDAVYANGDKADVNIIWGPDKSQVKDPSKWVDAGPIPSSKNQGHYVYLETYDINQDGALDIVTGGRRHISGKLNGLIWFEAPKNKNDREDLTKWDMHSIDANLLSGHGFVIEDLNKDGHVDIVVANPDWDTPDHEDMLLWYQNPGPHSEAIENPWKKHVVFKNQQLFAKPQVGIGDLNEDGKTDLVVQTDNYVFYLEQQENADDWKVNQINKPEITRWVTRPTKVVDIDGNGKLDIVGMTIHNYGYTPFGKASVFWMEYLGDKPGTDNWETHVIKWSDGIFSGRAFRGEKWDHMRFIDLDGDGDLDIIANCEEYYERIKGKQNTLLGVVWFENPTINP
jgi:hypothetical protein